MPQVEFEGRRRPALVFRLRRSNALLLVFIAALLSIAEPPARAAAAASGTAPSDERRDLAFLAPSCAPPKAENPMIAPAHAIVVRRSPEQGGVAAENIGKVEVWYDAGIRDAFAALAVIGASGERVDKRDAAIDKSDPSHVSVGVDRLVPGKYTVRYRALSADGHIVSGAWDFEVRP
jgi:hypothetical protein